MAEYFDIYDGAGQRIGCAPRKLCHGHPVLRHRTAHVVVFHPETGEVLLQKRRQDKDIQPGKWDTAVGGHLGLGETYEMGAHRELAEELGYSAPVELTVLFDSQIRNAIESEDVRVFGASLAGPFEFQKSEIDDLKFWPIAALFVPANQANFTPNLVAELELLRRHHFIADR